MKSFEKAIRTLEFDKIRSMLAEWAHARLRSRSCLRKAAVLF